jgi:hypothetical protein
VDCCDRSGHRRHDPGDDVAQPPDSGTGAFGRSELSHERHSHADLIDIRLLGLYGR